MGSSKGGSTRTTDEEKHTSHLETAGGGASHPVYYDKDGLRVDSDSEDHDHEPPMTFHRFMGFVAMAFLWTGSQIPVYLFGGIPPYIYADIGGSDRWVWFVLSNLLSLAGVCPFVGSLSDLMGRRYVAIIGASLVCIGMIVSSTANTMNIFIGGMAIAGAGAGVNELTALAATSEMAPTSKRGKYVAILVFTILPFAPAVLWAQLIASHAGWRYVGAFCGAWGGAGLLVTVFFYHPPARLNSKGMDKMEIIKRIDFLGGFLSISGMIVFLAGLQWGGYQYDWDTAHVLAPLVIGFVLLVAFCFWEIYGTDYPIFPSRLKQEPRILALTLLITFISGANFFSVIMFWPTQAFNVYGHDPVGVGVRGIPIGFGILAGACIVLWLLSIFRGNNRELMIVSSALMTAGCGAMSIADVDNLYQLWGILIVAALGIGGIVVPASIITTIICPDDLIATVAALTLSIRVIGGAVGYTIYYNVFVSRFEENAKTLIGGAMLQLGIQDKDLIEEAIQMTSAALIDELHTIPGIGNNATALEMVTVAGRIAFAESYKYVYYVSIAFGGVCTIAACFLGNINQYMDDHVAVVVH